MAKIASSTCAGSAMSTSSDIRLGPETSAFAVGLSGGISVSCVSYSGLHNSVNSAILFSSVTRLIPQPNKGSRTAPVLSGASLQRIIFCHVGSFACWGLAGGSLTWYCALAQIKCSVSPPGMLKCAFLRKGEAEDTYRSIETGTTSLPPAEMVTKVYRTKQAGCNTRYVVIKSHYRQATIDFPRLP